MKINKKRPGMSHFWKISGPTDLNLTEELLNVYRFVIILLAVYYYNYINYLSYVSI